MAVISCYQNSAKWQWAWLDCWTTGSEEVMTMPHKKRWHVKAGLAMPHAMLTK